VGYGPADPGRYAYSLKTGNQLWTDLDDKTTRTLGLFRGRVLRERLVTGDDGEESWLALHELDRAGGSVTDPATNSRSVLIGRVPSQGLASWVWSGRRAIAFSGAKISAYDLPVKGKKVDALPVAEALPWADGDLQPSTAPGACRRVSAETLAALGLASAKLPAPADCRWRETLDPSYVERNLRTSVDIATPTDSTTAQAAAERRAEKLTDTLKADGLTPSALEGLGDQAWFATRPSTDGAQTETAIVARWRNAVVLVRASQAGLIEDRYAELVRPDAVESAVVGAAREILAALGAPRRRPPEARTDPTPPLRTCARAWPRPPKTWSRTRQRGHDPSPVAETTERLPLGHVEFGLPLPHGLGVRGATVGSDGSNRSADGRRGLRRGRS
jgi:hypothetical protein